MGMVAVGLVRQVHLPEPPSSRQEMCIFRLFKSSTRRPPDVLFGALPPTRKEEATTLRRLRIEDVNFSTRTLAVRDGKGGKDGVGFFGAEAAQMLRAWLATRREVVPEDFLFVDRLGRRLTRHLAAHTLYRLSRRAGLTKKVGPHALRHYAATSILKQTSDLELVHQVLRYESLAMALRYAHLAKPEISQKFRRASPLDNLRAGR